MREVVNKCSLLLMVFLIARLLGKSALGQYTLALTISQILFLATDLGLNALLVREVAQDKQRAFKYLFNFGAMSFILSSATLILVGMVTWVLRCPSDLALIIYLCAFSYFVIRFINLFEFLFQAFEKMEYQFFSMTLKNIIFLPLGIWHLFDGGDLTGLFLIFLIANIITLLVMGFLAARIMTVRAMRVELSFIKEYTLKALPIWITQIFAIFQLKIATLLLYRLHGDAAVGIYQAGYIVVEGFLIASGILAMAFFPLFSRLYARSVDTLKRTYERSLSLAAFIFLPVAISIALLADRIVALLYGSGFAQTVAAMIVLSHAALFVVFAGLNGYTIITLDKQKILPFIGAFGLALSLVLNITLIPRFNYLGAAIASSVTEGIMLLTVLFIVRTFLLHISLIKIFLKSGIATAIVAVFISTFRHINIVLLLAAASVLYISLVYIMRGFVYQERAKIKVVFKNIRRLTTETM
jgi:O-antigen/teichoic acid export membrane protein